MTGPIAKRGGHAAGGKAPSGDEDSAQRAEDPSTRLVDLTAYYGHLECFRSIRPLMVKTNRFTYAPSYVPCEGMPNTWLSIALEGIGTLHAQRCVERPWQDVAVIGTGNGLDVVGISRIVNPRSIFASDIHPKALQAARWNIANHVAEHCRVTVIESDLFDAYPPGTTFDLIYENLPNIPDDHDLLDGVRSASCYAPRAQEAASEWDRHLLTLHHECLLQARGHLHASGWIVAVIGGRIPLEVILGMFRAAGYRPVVAAFSLKIQSEADVVVPAYAEAERATGISFAYYHPLDACIAIAREMPQPSQLEARETHAAALTDRLRAHRISAQEASRRTEAGDVVCHTAYVIAAQRAPLAGSVHG